MAGRGNRGAASAPSGGTLPPSQSFRSNSFARALEQRLLRNTITAGEIVEARSMQRAGTGQGSPSASASTSAPAPSSSRLWPRVRKALRKVLTVCKKKKPDEQDRVTGAATVAAARTGAGDQARPGQQTVEAACTRSEFAAEMRSALVKIQDGAAADDQAVFAEMERAMTGLMDLSHKKKSEPPELPRTFANKWLQSGDVPLHGQAMKDPIILASGHSVDHSYRQWSIKKKNTCLVTDVSLAHSLTPPNHLLRDMIAEWCLDHSNLAPSSTGDTHSAPLVPPSEEQIQDILEKFSRHSVLQKEALKSINLMSKTSKGMQPCLNKWPELIPLLIDLREKWKNVWSPEAETERISLIHNLSIHRPNREILADQNELPAELKNVTERAERLGVSASTLAMVASIVAALSEFDVFRKRMVIAGGMEMLLGLLKIKDAVVRKETCAAILALRTDDAARLSAAAKRLPEELLRFFMATDESLLLLDCLPKSPGVQDLLCFSAAELVKIVMEEDAGGTVTSEGIHAAISLIHVIAERDVGKQKLKGENVEDFKERLRELSSKGIPVQTMFQVEEILKTLSESSGA